MNESRKILIVDDEENLVRLLEMNLQRRGYEIHAAYDGVDGLRAAAEVHPDLMLLDVNMPLMEGFEVLQRMKADPELRDIPVVMLTAKAQTESLWHGIESGAEYYVTKPIDLPGLLGLVDKMLAPGDEQAA